MHTKINLNRPMHVIKYNGTICRVNFGSIEKVNIENLFLECVWSSQDPKIINNYAEK